MDEEELWKLHAPRMINSTLDTVIKHIKERMKVIEFEIKLYKDYEREQRITELEHLIEDLKKMKTK